MLAESKVVGQSPVKTRNVGTTPKDVWVIEPRGAGLVSRLQEAWRYRYLLRYFGMRVLEKSYKRTVLGRLWLLIRPLFPIIVGTFVFGGLLRVQSGGIPYFLFFMVGQTCWELFQSSWSWATRSLELNRKLLRKMYFPRIILPIAAIAPALVQFLISLVLIIVTALYYWVTLGTAHVILGWGMLWALGSVTLIVVLALALGLWTSVAGAGVRDVRFTLGYILQFLFFLTPVMYPISAVPERWRWLVSLNPLASFLETIKWGIFGIGGFDGRSLTTAVTLTAVVLGSGLWFFGRAEAAAIDRI